MVVGLGATIFGGWRRTGVAGLGVVLVGGAGGRMTVVGRSVVRFGVSTFGVVLIGGEGGRTAGFGAPSPCAPAARLGPTSIICRELVVAPGRRIRVADGSTGRAFDALRRHGGATGPTTAVVWVTRVTFGPWVIAACPPAGRHRRCSYFQRGCQPAPTSIRRRGQSKHRPSQRPITSRTRNVIRGGVGWGTYTITGS